MYVHKLPEMDYNVLVIRLVQTCFFCEVLGMQFNSVSFMVFFR